MFGKNKVSHPRSDAEGFLLKELFYTIQGEGPWAGYPAIFVRFAGCNLRCTFCDTDFEGGEGMSAAALAGRIQKLIDSTGCYRIVLTGGEPMLQPLAQLLENYLPDPRVIFQIETAGTVMPVMGHKAMRRLSIVCSPKTPQIHHLVEDNAQAFKYIIRVGELSPEDGLPTHSTQPGGAAQKLYRPKGQWRAIYVQPCDEGVGEEEKTRMNHQAAAAVAMRYGYRLSVQVHKIVGLR
jgi:7-carboxy-7-deazaguanine synthase